MNQQVKSIRAFIGAKNFSISRAFYKDLGFQEYILSDSMSYFNISDNYGFYLQNAYVEDWVNNSMLFLEIENVEQYFKEIQKLNLTDKYQNVKLVPIRYELWGKECFLHDPSGILWHFGEFNK